MFCILKTLCIFTSSTTNKHNQPMATSIEHTKKSNDVQLLTINQVKIKLNISRYTVYKLTEEGKLPVIKIRNCFRYKSEDVEKLLVAV